VSARPDKPVPYARTSLLLIACFAFVWAIVTAGIPLQNLMRGPGRCGASGSCSSAGLGLRRPRLRGDGRVGPDRLDRHAHRGVLSLPLALLAAKNVTGRASSTIARQILNAFRSIHELIFAVIFVTMVGLGPVAGALAIGIHSIGTLGKLASEAVEGIDSGPLEAADAAGATWLQKMRWGVIPQALPEIVSFWLYRFEINIRASAILGVIGAGGVGGILQNTVVYRSWDKAGMTLLVVVGVTLLIDVGVRR
jgi:ABC-type methionine transport system permease subunit